MFFPSKRAANNQHPTFNIQHSTSGLLSLAVGAGAVEVNQNVARFGAFAGADDAAVFQLVHDARRAGVAEAQPALKERDARLLFAADDFDALLDQVLVFVDAVFAVEAAQRFGELLVDFQFVTRFALPGDEFDDAIGLLVSDERALGADEFGGAGRQIEHVAFAEQFVGAHPVQDRARVHLRRDLKSDARRDVRLDDAGDDVHAGPLRGDDAMNAGGAGHLRDSGDGHFHVGGRGKHQVGEFVDDDDDVAELLRDDDVIVARHDDFLVHFDREPVRAGFDFFFSGLEGQFGFSSGQRYVLGPFVE